MALKIPDSPNVIGGTPVLRQAQTIRGTEVVDMSMDTKPLQEFVANAGEAYSKYLEDRERTEDQARYNGWVEHMTNFRTRLYDENQKGKAKDLYAKIKEESDNYVANTTKNLPASSSNRMRDWVASQMPGYMSSAANYEAEQNAIYRKEVNETTISRNAQVISTSDNPIEIQIARDNIAYTVRDSLRGSPEDLIASTIAVQQDQASVAMISNKMLSDPKGAADLLNGVALKESVLDYMSSKSIADCRKALIESARTQLINEYAAYQYSGEGAAAPNNAEMAMSILGPSATRAQIEWFMADVASEGNKKAEALKQEMVGVQNQMKVTLTKQLVEAETPQERQQAVQNAVLNGQIKPEDGQAILSSLTNESYYKGLEADLHSTVQEIARTTGDVDITDIVNKYETYYQGRGDYRIFDTMVISDQERYDEITREIEEKQEQLASGATGAVAKELALIGGANVLKTDKLQSDIDSLIAERDKLIVRESEPLVIPEAQMQKLRQYKLEQEKRFANAADVPELIGKISSGEIHGFDIKEFGKVGYGYYGMLMNISRVENEYRETTAKLKKAGVDIDSIAGNIDATFKKLDPTASSAVKRSVVTQINAWSKANHGDVPTADTVSRFVLNARANALSKEAVAVQNAIDKVYSEEDIIDSRLSESLAKRINFKEYAVSDRSYEKSIKRANTLLDNVADDLSGNHQNWIEMHKESLIPLVLSGRWDLITLQLKSIPGGI